MVNGVATQTEDSVWCSLVQTFSVGAMSLQESFQSDMALHSPWHGARNIVKAARVQGCGSESSSEGPRTSARHRGSPRGFLGPTRSLEMLRGALEEKKTGLGT